MINLNVSVLNKFISEIFKKIFLNSSIGAQSFLKKREIVKDNKVFKIHSTLHYDVNISVAFIKRTVILDNLECSNVTRIDDILKLQDENIKKVSISYWKEKRIGFLTLERIEGIVEYELKYYLIFCIFYGVFRITDAKNLIEEKTIKISSNSLSFKPFDLDLYIENIKEQLSPDKKRNPVSTMRGMLTGEINNSSSTESFTIKSPYTLFLSKSTKFLRELNNHTAKSFVKVSIEGNSLKLNYCENNEISEEKNSEHIKDWKNRSENLVTKYLKDKFVAKDISVTEEVKNELNMKDNKFINFVIRKNEIKVIGVKSNVEKFIQFVEEKKTAITQIQTDSINIPGNAHKEYLEKKKVLQDIRTSYEDTQIDLKQTRKIIVSSQQQYMIKIKTRILEEIVNTSEEIVKLHPLIEYLWPNIKDRKDELEKIIGNDFLYALQLNENYVRLISDSVCDVMEAAKKLERDIQFFSIDLMENQLDITESSDWLRYKTQMEEELKKPFYIKKNINRFEIIAVSCENELREKIRHFFNVKGEIRSKIAISEEQLIHLKNGLKATLEATLGINQLDVSKSQLAFTCKIADSDSIDKKIKKFLEEKTISLKETFTSKTDLFALQNKKYSESIFKKIGKVRKVYFKKNRSQRNILPNNTMTKRENSIIQLIRGNLCEQKVDVIFNNTSKNFDLTKGAVSTSLVEKAGGELTEEVKNSYPNGLSDGEVGVTKGYKINCKHILHRTLGKTTKYAEVLKILQINHYVNYTLKIIYEFQKIRDFLTDCFDKIKDLDNIESVALPSIGTGRLQYPPNIVAQTIKSVGENIGPKIGLKKILVVVYGKDHNTYSVIKLNIKQRTCTNKNLFLKLNRIFKMFFQMMEDCL